MITLTETMAQYRNLLLSEKWNTKMDTPKNKVGMFKGKTKAELRASLDKLKKESKKYHDEDRKEPESLKTKIKELEFALRAKNSFGKVSESFLKESVHHSLEAILQKYPDDVDQFIENGFNFDPGKRVGVGAFDPFYDELYAYYLPEMPYGTAKGRTGDPDDFISEHLSEYLEKNGLLPSEEESPLVNKAQIPAEALEEGKTQRTCMGQGCSKKCADGKQFCGKSCEKKPMIAKSTKYSNKLKFNEPLPTVKKAEKHKKKVEESLTTPGPFSKASKKNKREL